MRTIFLLQNVAGGWYVRTGSSNGQKVHTNEAYANRGNAVRAFIVEGRHQPFANMVVLVDGQKPMTIRAGRPIPVPDREAEDVHAARIKAALDYTRSTQ